MTAEAGSCTIKWRWGWKRGIRQVKPVPVRKLKPVPNIRTKKQTG